MRTGTMFDSREIGKRIRRLVDGNYSYRKILILIIICGGILLYFGPPFAQWLFSSTGESTQAFEEYCLSERLAPFRLDAEEYNVNILHNPPKETDKRYLPYIGNGIFGIPISPDAWLYIKRGRALSLQVQWQPLISHPLSKGNFHKEATVTDFTNGIVYQYQCLRDKYYTEFQYYAHRVFDAIMVQHIKIVNPFSLSQNVPLKPQVSAHWSNARMESIKIQVDDFKHEYSLISGFVPLPNSNKVVTVAILYKVPPRIIQVKARSTVNLKYFTSIQYSEPVFIEDYHTQYEMTKKKAIEAMKRVIRIQKRNLKTSHSNLWQSYWYTSLRISDSKADGAINGDKINSTIYYVLSHVSKGIRDVEKNVAMNEGCYRGHHTLDAPRLWKDTSTIDGVNNVVEAWLITLEKQGCHHLMTGDPSAVQQAIVLSLGSLRFSNQHLEFNIDPQYLHRDYLFRKISYGNVTHLNISVTVGEDNRAILGVALDKSDSVYFGCDAGCLDAPVSLSQSYTNFPVKLTKPLTAILYITSDHQHMQDLRNALHVHAVNDAPAHDHLVMALHKHGYQLGGLPTLFWVSICFLIFVFHLFLCKLIINEYYGHQDKQKVRYSKL
ncbi:PREDICTED: uncharacterized protein KIAA2013 homolog [Dufourea novaeangliae]|uniref:uncharacterized protein KIAA2013 homolog n=1 Tax=Dufourea novaeangliae TaxID=178035 RepID=UPI00076760B4|nr:PREDICTED: uncharacterized protein KIAA2013 homolog [Dufourea novaeangliae]